MKPKHASPQEPRGEKTAIAPTPSPKPAQNTPVRGMVSEKREKREGDGKACEIRPFRELSQSELVVKVHQLTYSLGWANYQIRRLTLENSVLMARYE